MHASKILTLLGAALAAASPVVRTHEESARGEAAVEAAGAPVHINAARHSTSIAAHKPTTTARKASSTKKVSQPTHTGGGSVPGEPNALEGSLTVGWVTPGSKTFIDIAVWHHNVHRANHSAPDAVWNNTLYQFAQQKAETCVYNEDGETSWGELGINIAGGTYGLPVNKPNPSAMISGLWYNSEVENYPKYGVGNPNYNDFNNWGHFSQLVWPTSTQIGCGLADCGTGWFGLCLYYPPGNWDGEFNTIGKPRGFPPVYPNGQSTMKKAQAQS